MDQEIYHKDILKKKQGKSEDWATFLAVLSNKTLSLYSTDKSNADNDSAEGKIHITPGARCVVVKRRTYSFRFKLVTETGSHFFKCASNLQRHKWMHHIKLAAQGRELSPHNPRAAELLLEHVRTDTDLKRYLYGEGKGRQEINNNDTKEHKGKPTLYAGAESAKLHARNGKAMERRRVKSATHLPWYRESRKVHACDTVEVAQRVENLAITDESAHTRRFSSENQTSFRAEEH